MSSLNYLFRFVLLAMIFALVSCASAAPRIVIEPSSQELGERPQEFIELTFTVRNQGNRPLKIDQVTTTCGCTKASVEQDTILPNGETILHVTMDPAQSNLYGNIYRVITLSSNDPATPKAQVNFHVVIPQPGGRKNDAPASRAARRQLPTL
ncbi:MAG: DUF1573 domain-containing protein [Chloroflexi bacterium]|nr:DUF1573 domain-containing protein [Chloroflexota bacterium]